MRLNNIPYQSIYLRNPRQSPSHKLPFIDDQGLIISDSTLILEHLQKKKNLAQNTPLSAQQEAQATAIQRMLEDHLYWIIVHSRWIDFDNWKKTRLQLFGRGTIQQLAGELFKLKIKNTLKKQGMSGLNAQALYAQGQKDINALAQQLGEKAYIMGDTPSWIDAIVFAFLVAILTPPLPSPLVDTCYEHENLLAYCRRMAKQTIPMEL